MKTNPDEPLNVSHGAWSDEMNKTYAGRGLTKREYFAALAMQGHFMLNWKNSGCENIAQDLAKGSVVMADALIVELNKGQPK